MGCARLGPEYDDARRVYVGPKGEGGLDDASGGNGGAGGASMKQSSAVVDLGAGLSTHLAATSQRNLCNSSSLSPHERIE